MEAARIIRLSYSNGALRNACLTAVAICLSLTIGCSNNTKASPEKIQAINSAELFLSRTSFSDTEFEHYKIFADKIFVECGVERHGRILPRKQQIIDNSNERKELLFQSAGELLARQSAIVPTLSTPGKNRSPADPGEYILSVETADGKKEIATSLDEAVNDQFGFGKDLGSFAELVRGSTPILCNNQVFFGLARKS